MDYLQQEASKYKKRVFIYIRVSTTEQAEEGYSLGEQEARLRKYCEAMEWEVVKVYSDPGYSGSNLERPGMKQMIKDIEKGEGDVALVDKLDRLSRSQFDTLYLIQKVFNVNNVAFVSRAEAFDTSTPFGRAMVGILAVFAELERERIKERMMEGKAGRAKEGRFPGGNALTYGYDYNVQSGLLEINKFESIVANEIFEMIADRVPLNTIARILNQKGYQSKQKKEWQSTSVRQMTANQTYIGKIFYKGEWLDGLHDPIISDDLFNRVQEIMKERDTQYERYKPGKRYNSPLGGLIWCEHCNGKYGWRKQGTNKDGSIRAYYMCYSRAKCDPKMVKDANCKNRNYRDKDIEEAIFNEILKLKSNENYYSEIKSSVDPTVKIEEINKQIEIINNQISKLMDLYSVDGISLDAVKEKIKPLNEQRNNLESELESLEYVKAPIERDEVIRLVDIFEQVLSEGNSADIHDAIMELIDYIEIDNDDVKIHWNF